MSERCILPIGALGRVVTGRTPPSSNLEFFEGDIPFLTPTDMNWDQRHVDPDRFVSSDWDQQQSRVRLPARAVCVVCIGATIGKICMTDGVAHSNQQINSIIVDEARFDPDFIFYRLRLMRQEFTKRAAGAATPILNKSAFSAVEVDVPPLPTQRRIASILGAYDDLIEVNWRRIAVLEEMARRLFEEWFVHFRFPGHETHKMVETADGGQPAEWMSVPIESVCSKYDDGDWLETKDQGGEDFRIVQISNIGANCFVETGNWRGISEATFRRLSCQEIQPGDILVSRMPRPIGRGWMVWEMPFRMVTAVDGTIVRADTTKVDPFFLLFHINSDLNIRRCEANATGTTRPRIARRTMGRLPVILPPLSLQRQFGRLVAPLHELRRNLFSQNDRLTRSRDLLLPRLISGELPVTVDEKQLQAAD